MLREYQIKYNIYSKRWINNTRLGVKVYIVLNLTNIIYWKGKHIKTISIIKFTDSRRLSNKINSGIIK